MIIRSEQGLYTVPWSTEFVTWLKWRCWNYEALGVLFSPQRLTTKLADPPETQEGADMVYQWHVELRAEVDKESRRQTDRKWPTLRKPTPFLPWTPQFCARLDELETARRKIDGRSFLMAPAYKYDAARVVGQLKDRAESATLARGAGMEHPFRESGNHTEDLLRF